MNHFPAFRTLRQWSSQLPKLTHEMILYGLGGSIAQVVWFLIVPILTRSLDKAEFASVNIINAATGYFSIIISVNFVAGIVRYYLEAETTGKEQTQSLVSTMTWFTLVFGTVIALLGTLFSRQLSLLLFRTDTYAVAISLALLSLPLVALRNSFSTILRLQHRPLPFLLINFAYAVGYFIFIVLFVVVLQWKVTGAFLALFIASLLFVIITAIPCRDQIRLTFSRAWLNLLSRFGLPTLPGSLFQWGMISINNLLLAAYMVNWAEIAYYNLALKAAKIVEFAVLAFVMAWQPVFMAGINSQTFYQKLNKALWYFILGALTLVSMVTVFSHEIVLVLASNDYLPAIPLIPILSSRYVLVGVVAIVGLGILRDKKTHFISIALAAGFLVTLAAGSVLIPVAGIMGASIADLSGELVNAGLYFYFSNRIAPLKWNLKRVFAAFALTALLAWAVNLIPAGNVWLNLGLRLVLFLVYFVILFVGLDQRSLIKTFIERISNLRTSPKVE